MTHEHIAEIAKVLQAKLNAEHQLRILQGKDLSNYTIEQQIEHDIAEAQWSHQRELLANRYSVLRFEALATDESGALKERGETSGCDQK